MTLSNLTKEDLLTKTDTAPGRVRTYLLQPERNTTPHSCTLYVYDGDLAVMIAFVARALKGGAGVKIIFPRGSKVNPFDSTPKPTLNWSFSLSVRHPEFESVKDDSSYISLGRVIKPFYTIADSMEGEIGILTSWEIMIDKLSKGIRVHFDLSNIRPKGTVNNVGLIASGAESFLQIYKAIASHLERGTIFSLLQLLGTLNDIIRRGNQYKNGIITSSMDYRCPLIFDYLKAPIVEVLGSHKKGVAINDGVFENPKLVQLICDSRNSESTFIEKIDHKHPDIHANVCVGLKIPHKGTCLIWRVNLGLCTLDDIIPAFIRATLNLCELHVTWRKQCGNRADIYAPLEEDRQIGLDVMGLANLLAIEGISYLEFVEALEYVIKNRDLNNQSKAQRLANHLIDAYMSSCLVVDEFMRDHNLPLLDRIHTVEPAQQHSYETRDREGNVTCRGIFAPFARRVNRTSDTQKNIIAYHGEVEESAEIGSELHKRLCNAWQKMMTTFGRAHAISQDSYEEMNADRLKDFINSDSLTLYYAEHSNFNQRKYLQKKALTATVSSVIESPLGNSLVGTSSNVIEPVFVSEDTVSNEPYRLPREGECSSCAE